jgi:uncharacterized membrane protein
MDRTARTITPFANASETGAAFHEDAAPPIVCPVCGGSNAGDAVFCANPACGKALGEFRYALEEIARTARWHETLAERVTAFIGHPYYVAVHMVWFALWVAVNTGIVVMAHRFDEYPFGLLGILLSIEAIFITGFVLIAQNRQSAHADLRARLDYEVNVRTYRELRELRAMVAALQREVTALRAGPRAGDRD